MHFMFYFALFYCAHCHRKNGFETCIQDSKIDLFYQDNIYLDMVISPVVNEISDAADEIRIIWSYEIFEINDSLVLYENQTQVFYSEITSEGGHLDTGIFYNSDSKYRVDYKRKHKTVANYFYKKYPNWMNDVKMYLEDFNLMEIFIPGTHLSSAYYLTDKNQGGIYKYVFTQDEDIINQLNSGIRYLDLRIGHYNSTDEKWWCNHDFFPMRPLQTVLNQVITFLNQTNEIIIIDFHRFPIGFDENVHNEFSNYIEDEMKDFLYYGSDSCNTKLKDIWDSGKRLLISYNNKNVYRNFYMNPPVRQRWGNKQNLQSLYVYISKSMADSSFKCWSMMAELTAKGSDVIFDRLGGLRKMADMVNTNLTIGFNEEWSSRANIVSVDFAKSTGIVSAALKSNVIKYCRKKYDL